MIIVITAKKRILKSLFNDSSYDSEVYYEYAGQFESFEKAMEIFGLKDCVIFTNDNECKDIYKEEEDNEYITKTCYTLINLEESDPNKIYRIDFFNPDDVSTKYLNKKTNGSK